MELIVLMMTMESLSEGNNAKDRTGYSDPSSYCPQCREEFHKLKINFLSPRS